MRFAGGIGAKAAPLLLALALSVLAGCATNSFNPTGAGWSRAPDLSVYGSMQLYGRTAREAAILCGGFSPASVREHWDEDFAAREAAVTAALIARHGAEAVERANVDPRRRIYCPTIPDASWRGHYARLLRLLEVRLDLA